LNVVEYFVVVVKPFFQLLLRSVFAHS
jgi:hypothetical protein